MKYVSSNLSLSLSGCELKMCIGFDILFVSDDNFSLNFKRGASKTSPP